MRKTKIICTIGPSTCHPSQLKKLAESGMNIARINMSLGSHEDHVAVIDALQKINQDLPSPVGIMMDIQGPEILTGQIGHDLKLNTGDVISISVHPDDNVEETSVHIDYEPLIDRVIEGDRITVDHGLINLEILEKHESRLSCKVIEGGLLKSQSHVNLPGIRVNAPAITKKDRVDIAFAIAHQLDFIALSFVRSGEDIRCLQRILNASPVKSAKIKIIAKIEDEEGVRNITSIIRAADAIMIARGDLGVEVAIEELPNIQRRIVRECAIEGKPVIVATHLLESMIKKPIPTCAEVTDVANAVYQEVDALMLSGETTVGQYPIKCVEYLNRIALSAEKNEVLDFSAGLKKQGLHQQLALSAVKMAEDQDAKGIICITDKGKVAGFASATRVKQHMILAFTAEPQVLRQMNLFRGVQSFLVSQVDDTERCIEQVFALIKAQKLAVVGDQFVIISDLVLHDCLDNIQLRSLT